MPKEIHFHSSDTRFCGSDEIGRRFTMDENEVTCQLCRDRDAFVISASGMGLLRKLGYMDEQGQGALGVDETRGE